MYRSGGVYVVEVLGGLSLHGTIDPLARPRVKIAIKRWELSTTAVVCIKVAQQNSIGLASCYGRSFQQI